MVKIENEIFFGIQEQIKAAENVGDNRTANHFFRLLRRLQTGKNLTKKMSENLAAIKKTAEEQNGRSKFSPEDARQPEQTSGQKDNSRDF